MSLERQKERDWGSGEEEKATHYTSCCTYPPTQPQQQQQQQQCSSISDTTAEEAADDKLVDGSSEDDLTETSEDSERDEFQAEVSRVMDIIINSSYTDKQVFLPRVQSSSILRWMR